MLQDFANDGGFVVFKRTAEDREVWRQRKDVKNLLYIRRLLIMTDDGFFVNQLIANRLFVYMFHHLQENIWCPRTVASEMASKYKLLNTNIYLTRITGKHI